MHLCQVVPYASYPPRRGGDHRTHGIVKEFPSYGDTVTRYCQGGTPETYRSRDLRRRIHIDDGYEEHRHFHPIHELVKAPMLFGYPNVFASNALQLADDGLPELLETADVVMVREPWQMPHVINTAPADTPIVFSSHNVEIERFEDINRPAFDNRTMQRVRELEQAAVTKADAVVCTSERDADVYQNEYEMETPTIVAPNGTYNKTIRKHRPNSDDAVRVRREYSIDEEVNVCLFMGSDYQPNVEAAEKILNIAREPRINSECIQFIILGSVGKSINEQSVPDNVTITGYVEEDFEAHFDASDIALNPMITGGGTNIKLFDYFARELPTISTPFGARGIDIQDGIHLKIADIEVFSRTISTLTSDAMKRKRLAQAAKQLTKRQYTWEQSSKCIRSKLSDLNYID